MVKGISGTTSSIFTFILQESQRRRKKVAGNLFEKIMAENFSSKKRPREEEEPDYENNQKMMNKMAISTYLSIVTLVTLSMRTKFSNQKPWGG